MSSEYHEHHPRPRGRDGVRFERCRVDCVRDPHGKWSRLAPFNQDAKACLRLARGARFATQWSTARGAVLAQSIPGEEILFAPLTGLEVMDTAVGSVLLVRVRLSVNLAALTIEQVVSKRRK